MNVAALLEGDTIAFYDYTGQPPPYDGIAHAKLDRMGCNVLRDIGSKKTMYWIPLQNEGVLEVDISPGSMHLFENVALDPLIFYFVNVYRGKIKKVPGYTVCLRSVPCFVEDGILFGQSEIQAIGAVKNMR
jgi:hypothetical protein